MSELTTTPFKHYFEFNRLMGDRGRALGWARRDTKADKREYVKRFGDVWYRMMWDDHHWTTSVHLVPTTFLRLTGDFDTYYPLVTAHMTIVGATFQDFEEKVAELARAYKRLAKPPKARDLSSIYYERDGSEYTGKEAVEHWKNDVVTTVMTELDGFEKERARHPYYNRPEPTTTTSIINNVLDNYGIKLEGVSDKRLREEVRLVLESLARHDKLTKSDGRNWKDRQTRWWPKGA
jgi:hypothetical protein